MYNKCVEISNKINLLITKLNQLKCESSTNINKNKLLISVGGRCNSITIDYVGSYNKKCIFSISNLMIETRIYSSASISYCTNCSYVKTGHNGIINKVESESVESKLFQLSVIDIPDICIKQYGIINLLDTNLINETGSHIYISSIITETPEILELIFKTIDEN